MICSSMGWRSWWSLASVAVTLLLSTASAGADCPDDYLYTQQPPAESVCNPYINGVLQLDCAIVGENILEIRWFFSVSADTQNPVLLSNSSKYTLLAHHERGTSGLQLTVNDLNETQDIGFYWCQAFVPDGSLTTSEVFQLLPGTLYFNSPCNMVLRRSGTSCASIIRTPSTTTQVSTTPPPTPPVTPSHFTPTHTPVFVTQETTTVSTTASSTDTNQANPTSLVEPFEFTLYIVLALVASLGIVCLALAAVIIVLCRKRCQGSNLNGAETKEVGFDHLSNQSDFALLSVHKRSSPPLSPYQPESSQPTHTNTQGRDSSGDYAEIGPALIMNSDRLHHLHSYSEIRNNAPPLPEPNPRMTAFHSSLGMRVDPHGITSYENPYDIPVLPPIDPRPGVTEVDSGTSPSQNYHVLERMTSTGSSGLERETGQISETSSFSTPPDSPSHNYQTLESPTNTEPSFLPSEAGQLPPGSSALPSGVNTLASSSDLIEQTSFPPQLYDASQDRRSSRLETIPEHPYHVLEKEHQYVTSQASALQSEGRRDDQISNAIRDDDCESNKDKEYDRLVSPPHLYHILEHSPSVNKPRIHQFQFSDYNHLDKAAPMAKELVNPAIHILPSQTTELSTFTESLSSESSLNDSEVFDDPQYLLSPEPERKCEQSCQAGAVHTCTHGRPPVFVQPGLMRKTKEAVDMSKYSGDYERDPLYMRRLQSISPQLLIPSSSTPEKHRDSTISQDDSGFYTYSAQSEMKRQSSLPDITHVYQSLQPKTMDPLLPYEKVQKPGSQSSESST